MEAVSWPSQAAVPRVRLESPLESGDLKERGQRDMVRFATLDGEGEHATTLEIWDATGDRDARAVIVPLTPHESRAMVTRSGVQLNVIGSTSLATDLLRTADDIAAGIERIE